MTVLRDLSVALRRLRSDYLVTIVIVLQLSLAIGANTAIFSLINALLLRSLPVDRPHELVALTLQIDTADTILSYPAFRALRERQEVFAEMTAIQSHVRIDRARETGQPDEFTVNATLVSDRYFQTLGLHPAAGRFFPPGRDRVAPSADVEHRVLVISHGFWERQFGRRPATLGAVITLAGERYTIVGVTPKGFTGETIGATPDAWLLFDHFKTAEELQNPNIAFFQVMARLKPGVDRATAAARTQVLLSHIVMSREFGPTDQSLRPKSASKFRVTLDPAGGGLSYIQRQFSRLLQIVLAVVGLVLLAACLNVGSLLVAQASTRAKDVAVCLAMGATWRPIVRQFMAQSLLLGLAGGVCGLIVAIWSRQVLLSLVSLGFLQVSIELPIDWRVLAFTGAVSLLTSLLLGVLPVWQLRALDLHTTLKREAQGHTGARQKLRLRRLLIVSQVAISLTLVIGAALLVKSLHNVRAMGPGFDVRNVLVVDLQPRTGNPDASTPDVLHRTLVDTLSTVRGVTSVSDSWLPLFTRDDMYAPMIVEGYTPRAGESMNIRFNCVSSAYFETLGIGLVRGRAIADDDRSSAPHVAVINEALAARYLPGQNPIGKILRIDYAKERQAPITIVGLVRDTSYNDLRQAAKPMLFLSIFQHPREIRSIEIRTEDEPSALIPQVRAALRGLGSRLAIREIRTMADQVARPLAREKLIAQLLAFFSVLCLLLMCIGIYGLISYVVSQRTKEIGLRMAIGAQRREVLWLLAREVLLLVSVGIVVGLPLALMGAQVLAAFLIGLRASDPAIALGSALLVLGSGALAGLAPGRKASRIQPAIALRYE